MLIIFIIIVVAIVIIELIILLLFSILLLLLLFLLLFFFFFKLICIKVINKSEVFNFTIYSFTALFSITVLHSILFILFQIHFTNTLSWFSYSLFHYASCYYLIIKLLLSFLKCFIIFIYILFLINSSLYISVPLHSCSIHCKIKVLSSFFNN